MRERDAEPRLVWLRVTRGPPPTGCRRPGESDFIKRGRRSGEQGEELPVFVGVLGVGQAGAEVAACDPTCDRGGPGQAGLVAGGSVGEEGVAASGHGRLDRVGAET